MNLLSLPSHHHLSSLAGSRSFHSLRRYLLSTFGTEQWGFSTVMGSYHYCGRDKKKIEKRYNKDDSQGHLLQGKGTHRSSVVMIRKSPLPSRGESREGNALSLLSRTEKSPEWLEWREQHGRVSGEAREVGRSRRTSGLFHSAQSIVGKNLQPSPSPLHWR